MRFDFEMKLDCLNFVQCKNMTHSQNSTTIEQKGDTGPLVTIQHTFSECLLRPCQSLAAPALSCESHKHHNLADA